MHIFVNARVPTEAMESFKLARMTALQKSGAQRRVRGIAVGDTAHLQETRQSYGAAHREARSCIVFRLCVHYLLHAVASQARTWQLQFCQARASAGAVMVDRCVAERDLREASVA